MSSDTSAEQQKEETESSRSVFKGLMKIGIFIAVSAAIFFFCAGRLNLVMA